MLGLAHIHVSNVLIKDACHVMPDTLSITIINASKILHATRLILVLHVQSDMR